MQSTSSIQLDLFDLPITFRSTRRKSIPVNQPDRDSYGRIVAKEEPMDEATRMEAERRKQLAISNTLRRQEEKIQELTQKLKDHGIT
jgi:hypothetical protein